MGSHDDYGKQVLQMATDGTVKITGASIEIRYGAGLPARIDGTIGDIAVEIESRTSKQVRGAILDLVNHPYPKKLLMLLPVHMQNPEITARQAENIFSGFLSRSSYLVIILRGSGDEPKLEDDVAIVRNALRRLGLNEGEMNSLPAHFSEANPSETVRQIGDSSRGPKQRYARLEEKLRALPRSIGSLELTFQHIEEILGFGLPPSALKYRAWWSNQQDFTGRPQAKAWLDAGFRVESVSLNPQNRVVMFVRLR